MAQLRASGELDDGWGEAFVQVPRHLFIPDTIWLVDHDGGGRLRPLCHDDDPDRWLRCAYQDRPVDIQVDDGHPAADGTGYEVTSSASQPSVVAGMLRALAPEPGMRVLEIGTGSGWNAALLAHRLGAENIVSIEIDPAVADQARGALDRAGFGKLTVITGDGEDGWPDGAPYDRVIATVGASMAATAIGQRLGDGVHATFTSAGPDTGTQWLLDPGSKSWASVDLNGAPPPYPVAQAGPRRLFDEAAAAYTWWVNTGKPGVEDWVVHVGPHGQTIALS